MKCAYCDRESDELQRDHVVPRSRGGPDNAFNLVMACQSCNYAKRDSLASEWLGERCPSAVLEIERRVNAKLEAKFSKRDYKRKPVDATPKLFAYSVNLDGGADYMGEVMEDRDGMIRMEVVDAFMATGCGVWSLSGNIKDMPREKCELFNDKAVCLESALRRNWRIYARKPEPANAH